MLEKLEVHSMCIMEALYMEYTQVHSTQLFNALCKEFNLKKSQFLQVKNEYKSLDKVFLVDYKEEDQTDFRLVAIKLFFYDFAKEVVTKEDYFTKIPKLINKVFPQFEDSEYVINVEKVVNGEISLETIYWYVKKVFERESFNSCDISYIPRESLNEQLESFLEIPDFEADKMCQKYIKKQIKNYLAYLKEDGDSLEDLIEPVEQNLRICLMGGDNNFNIQAYKFGYTVHKSFTEGNYGFLIKETIVQEIKAVLAEKLQGYISEENNSLGTTQIMRLASIEDFESFHKRVLRSCVEYCYYKEIANTNREFVLDELFGREQVVKTEIIEKEAPADEKLLAQIEQLKKENESLKGSLSNKQKAFDAELRSLREDNNKAIQHQKKANIELLRENTILFLMLEIAMSQEHEDDLLIPYDLERIKKKRIFVLGGREEVKRELEKLIPQAVFIKDENQQIPTGKCDCIFIFHEYFNHATFNKYIHYARKNDIPVGYTPSTNMERVLSDLYATIIRLDELKIPDFIIKD